MKQKENDGALMDSARDDVILAGKKMEGRKVLLIIEPLSILKSKRNNNPYILCSYRSLGTK